MHTENIDSASLKSLIFTELISQVVRLIPQASGLAIVMVLRVVGSGFATWWFYSNSFPLCCEESSATRYYTYPGADSITNYNQYILQNFVISMCIFILCFALLTLLGMLALNSFIRDLTLKGKASFTSGFHWKGIAWNTIKGQLVTWLITVGVTLLILVFGRFYQSTYVGKATNIFDTSSPSFNMYPLLNFVSTAEFIFLCAVLILGYPFQYVRSLVGLGSSAKQGLKGSPRMTLWSLRSQGLLYVILLGGYILSKMYIAPDWPFTVHNNFDVSTALYLLVMFLLLMVKYLSMAVVYIRAHTSNLPSKTNS